MASSYHAFLKFYSLLPAHCFFCWDSLSTFFTTFCSSIKNARTTLSFTQFEHLEPPYARWTVFLGLEMLAYSRGRRAGICPKRLSSVLLV